MAKVSFRVSEDIDLFLNNTYKIDGVDVALPSQTGHSGKYLTTNGSAASWESLPFNYAEETTLTTNNATTIDTLALSTFTGAEFIISLKQGSKVRTSKLIMQTDGTDVDISEYAIVETGGSISGVDISATVSGSNALLQATVTDASTTNVIVTVLRVNGEQTASGIVTTSGIQTLTNKTIESPILTGTVSIPSNTITSDMILSNTIVNADINSAAAIALSKLATDPLARANHTGTQTASTISDFNEAAQDAVGLILGSGLTYTDASNTITIDSSVVQLRISGLTDTELGYLDGVTSNVQAQIDSKASLSGATFTGAVNGTDLTLSGNLTVNGTTTNINSTNLVVEDKNIVLGDTTSPTDVSADGGGITLKGTTDKTFNWVDSTDAWTSSEHINISAGKSFKVNNVAISTSLPALTWGDLKNGKSGLTIS